MKIDLTYLNTSSPKLKAKRQGTRSSSKIPFGQSQSKLAEGMEPPVYGSSFSGQRHRAKGKTKELEQILVELESFTEYNAASGEFVVTVPRSTSYQAGDAMGYIDPHGYYKIGLNKAVYLISRLVWLWHTGDWPKHRIDHIDQNKLNNKIENLRDASAYFNNKNGKTRASKSGMTGINWHKKAKKWMACVTVAYDTIYLGLFLSIEEAIEARNTAIQNNPQWGYLTDEKPTQQLRITLTQVKHETK